MKITEAAIVRAIQEAVDAAEKRGVNVVVKIEERGFFSSERDTLTITAQRRRVRKPKQPASS